MHEQPIYHWNGFVTSEGDGRAKANAYILGGMVEKDGQLLDIGMGIFNREPCLSNDNKLTPKLQDIVIKIIKSCFEYIIK